MVSTPSPFVLAGRLDGICPSQNVEETDSGESDVPGNVRAQLQVWEDHNSRISCDHGVLFEWDPL